MRVLQINSVYGVRSTGRICAQISSYLQQNGHECLNAYGRVTVRPVAQERIVRIGSSLDVSAHLLKTRLLDAHGFASRNATKRFLQQVREFDPDVIHLHNLHGYYLNIEELFGYLSTADKPVVWTLHDCWAMTGHCSHFAVVDCERWKTGCHDCMQSRNYPSTKLLCREAQNWERKKELFGSVKNMALVTPSDWMAQMVAQSYLRQYPTHVIPNGINLQTFRPTPGDFRQRYALQDKYVVLGVATAWSVRKGLYEFYGLADALGEEYQVVLVGLTQQQISQLPDNILGIGKTDSVARLVQIYTAADVFVHPGRQESMGMTTVEAMACGTPVVVSPLTAIPEPVTPQSGIVVDDLTVEALAQAVRQTRRQTFQPRQTAEKYDVKLQCQQYLKLYEQMLSK